MNASDRFFAKLRSLALTLESETVQLQQTQKNPGDGGTQGALKVLCELHTEVRDLKGKVQEELACWTAEEKETRAFIRACLVLKQRTTEDLRRIQRHYEKYGYRPLDSTVKPTEAKGPEKDPRAPVVEQDGDGGVQEQEGKEGQDAKEADALEQPASCRTPVAPPPPTPDTMRTPRLSDFGLSGFQPMESVGALSAGFRPTIAIETPPLLDPPKMPKTPKCVLQMDEDAPTPRLEDFGISEYTTCFNNDFTMELLRKQPAKAWRDTAAPADAGPDQKPANCSTAAATAPPGHSQEALELHSVKLPDFCTPVSKVNQKQTPHSPPDDLLGSALQLSPELPVFETPYVSKLMSTVKSTKMASSDSAATDEVKTHPPSGDAEHDKTSLCDLPSMAARPVPREESTPEMPVLETFITSSVAPGNENVSSRVAMFVENEPQLPDLQSHPEEWDLLSPPPQSSQTLHLPAPDTPQMPDVSLFTQDIIKLLSQSNTRTPAMVPPSPKSTVLRSPTAASGKENRSQVLAPVSEDEFAALPGYLRQMPLSSMNQAIGKINRAVMDKHCTGARETPSFMMEELKRITSTGVKAHLYTLCLTELGRLQQVQEESSGLVFRVLGQVQGRDKNATLRTPC